ncbi:MAG TPA: 7TM diverse intracellular signaling domain-containing protein, partial [Dongiaceae bacterium]|nr:7TM diverse intracellular signaling domain-containing protein [Dongiaceae bacterium]
MPVPHTRREHRTGPLPFTLTLLLAACLLWSAALPARALELVLQDDTSFRSQNAATGIEYLRDGDDHLTWEAVQQQPASAWSVSNTEIPSFGFDTAAHWLRLQVRNASSARQSLVLDIAYPILDDIQVHLLFSDGSNDILQLGDKFPFASRPIDHHNFAVPLKLDAGMSAWIYLRVQTGTSVQIPLTLWDREHFFEQQQRYLMGQGLYFGILLVMAVYNLFIFISVRNSAYVYYAISVAGMACFMASLHGFGFQYVWPEFPSVNNWITTVSLSLFVGTAAGFTNSLLQMKKNSPRFYYVLLATGLIYAVLILLTPWLSYALRIKVGTALGVASSLTALAAGSYVLHKGVRTARYYVMAYSFLVFGFVTLSLNKFGLLPRNTLTEFSAQICSVIEIVLLSFALADRINEERREKYKAKQLALEHEKRAREEQERYLRLHHSKELEELQAQQKIIAAQAESRAKSEFLATMSHEIRTPMNGVLGMAELLQDTELQSQQRQYLDVITSSGKALLQILNDILDYSKISAGKLALEQIEFDLAHLCRDCAAMFAATAERKQIALRSALEPGTPNRIQGDP